MLYAVALARLHIVKIGPEGPIMAEVRTVLRPSGHSPKDFHLEKPDGSLTTDARPS
jgi:hypothetical protein